MSEVTEHEINVDQLMAEIRQAVARREADGKMQETKGKAKDKLRDAKDKVT